MENNYIKSDLIKKEKPEKNKETTPVHPSIYDQLTYNLKIFEQYVDVVVECSSHYNRATSVLYSPENLKGKPSKYPNAGDHPWAYMLRSYGKWWNECESAQRPYMVRNGIESEDFVIVKFEVPVIPAKVTIYETYNPGAIVRIFGRSTAEKWYLLWKIEPSEFKKVTEAVRTFSPPIKKLPILVNEIRIELNQSLLSYHTAIDAILLAGYRPEGRLIEQLIKEEFLQDIPIPFVQQPCIVDQSSSYITGLSNEMMLKIFKYCDLQTLGRCAQVCHHWKNLTDTAILYSEVDLQKYWHKIDKRVMEQLSQKCQIIKKLDFSWCGNDEMRTSPDIFMTFLNDSCSRQLTHLSLNYCDFLTEPVVYHIANFSEITDLRLKNCKIMSQFFTGLACLRKLIALDLSSSSIRDPELLDILSNNWDLKHLIVDNCYGLYDMDEVTKTISIYNKQLVSLSTWQNPSLTTNGVANLALCTNLRELDVGWCLMLSEAGNSLELISRSCFHLRKLVISGWRGMSDQYLKHIILKCPELYHLDILGIRNITGEIGELALKSLPNLRLLDISFCALISREQVQSWRRRYPNVTIQRSCESHTHHN